MPFVSTSHSDQFTFTHLFQTSPFISRDLPLHPFFVLTFNFHFLEIGTPCETNSPLLYFCHCDKLWNHQYQGMPPPNGGHMHWPTSKLTKLAADQPRHLVKSCKPTSLLPRKPQPSEIIVNQKPAIHV